MAQLSDNASVFATGLDNPRGLKFGPDGNLYVAEGGIGGSISTEGQCPQVVPPIGPYTGGFTARISKIDAAGIRSTVIDQLPSSQTSQASGGLVSGVADIAFLGDTLYAVLAGAGCSHGIADVPNGIIRVNANGSWGLVADLSEFVKTHPVAHPEADDFEPDGTWYSMVAVRGDLYAVEPNHGELDRIAPAGGVTRVVDISASQGHIVPTALAYHGNFYVGNLNVFPPVPGSAKVLKITPGGQLMEWAPNFTTVLGVAFDNEQRMYVLESFPGRVLRVGRSGVVDTIATGLTLPTGMTFGPDGNLYISNKGFRFPAGAGEIVRVQVH